MIKNSKHCLLNLIFLAITTSKFELPANDRRLTDSGDEVVKSSTIDEVDETKKIYKLDSIA